MEKNPHVLIVEDDAAMRRITGGRVKKMGWESFYANNGSEGWDMARNLVPDMILMDYKMPEMDGMELATRLRNDELTKTIPIVLLTNEDLTFEAQKSFKELGISEYLHKSASEEELDQVLRRVMEEKVK